MTALDLQTLAQVFTGRLLNSAVEGVVLVGVVWALLRLIGRQNSGTRFAVWFSALLAIVVLPFLAGSGFSATHSPALATRNLHREIILSSSWAFCLFVAWGVGAGFFLLRLGVGLWRVRGLLRNCSNVDVASGDPAIAGIFRDFSSRRRVKLCVSNEVAVPTAIGFFRPAIVFPAWLLPQLSAGEINVILLHELAHLRRWDDWTNLAQKIVRAVFFFHPAVWWIENRLTLEREMACDDMVLAQTSSPRDYASSLISFAEKLQNTRSLTLVQALVSRMCHLSLRVSQILDAKRPSRTGLWKPVLGVTAGMLSLVFTAAPCAPRFVAFENQVKPSQTAQIQARKQATQMTSPVAGSEARPEATDAAKSRTVRESVARPSGFAWQAGATRTAFTPRTSAGPRLLRATLQRNPAVMRATAEQRKRPIEATLVILQTTQYDESGSASWTLCVWRVERGTSAERQLEQAIVLDLL
jgi:beta-lactamase regulating signal transducer with metallopeptidase domain